MKKLFCLLLVIAMAIPVFAEKIDFEISGKAPTVTGPAGPGGIDTVGMLNGEIKKSFDNALVDLKKQFNEIEFGKPKKFLGAMGNSSVYGSHGATTRGYGGYKAFSITLGPMFGFQLPSADIASLMDNIGDLSDTLQKDGDINLGVSPNAINVDFGLNMGFIKLDKLYLGLRVGYFKLPSLAEGFSYDYFMMGPTVNYQIIPSVDLLLIKWRGVSLGSGLLFNNSNIKVSVPLGDSINQPIGTGMGTLHMEPKASLKLKVNTVTIPLEAVTAVKLLIFNIPLGLGVDFAFGETSLGFGVDSDIELQNLPANYQTASKGDISVKAGASNNPTFFNFKIMTGFGFSLGPVVIDIPFTYYPAGPGYNLGLTLGAVF